MSTHGAAVTASIRGPLQVIQIPIIKPTNDEVLVKVEWTVSTPLNLHQNDGGLLVNHPQVLGDGVAGTVVEVGSDAERLQVGDKVFGFAWRSQKEKAHQELATIPEYLLGVIPPSIKPQEAVTLPNNFVTVFHAAKTDLGLSLPWPRPSNFNPPNASSPILIWGGSSSVGQFALQILSWYGYTNLLTTASPPHHQLLKSFGAEACFDYREPNVVKRILKSVEGEKGGVKLVLDCIGSQRGSLEPLVKIMGKGSKVAVLLPVIVRDASETEAPIYEMDAEKAVSWEEGVEVRGVRTHFYLRASSPFFGSQLRQVELTSHQNELFKEKLQPEIMPTLLEQGIVKPNKYRLIEGKTLLDRAQAAMNALRRKEVSGERLVWRVAE